MWGGGSLKNALDYAGFEFRPFSESVSQVLFHQCPIHCHNRCPIHLFARVWPLRDLGHQVLILVLGNFFFTCSPLILIQNRLKLYKSPISFPSSYLSDWALNFFQSRRQIPNHFPLTYGMANQFQYIFRKSKWFLRSPRKRVWSVPPHLVRDADTNWRDLIFRCWPSAPVLTCNSTKGPVRKNKMPRPARFWISCILGDLPCSTLMWNIPWQQGVLN